MVGIGGLPVAVANDPANLTTTCGTHSCRGDETGPDAEICAGCKCPDYNLTDPKCKPCLYNVAVDPGEQASPFFQISAISVSACAMVVAMSTVTSCSCIPHYHWPP
jgi:hypothetical protein